MWKFAFLLHFSYFFMLVLRDLSIGFSGPQLLSRVAVFLLFERLLSVVEFQYFRCFLPFPIHTGLYPHNFVKCLRSMANNSSCISSFFLVDVFLVISSSFISILFFLMSSSLSAPCNLSVKCLNLSNYDFLSFSFRSACLSSQHDVFVFFSAGILWYLSQAVVVVLKFSTKLRILLTAPFSILG